MSLIKAIKAQLGLSVTPANNFTLDASADNGTMKLARGNAGATTQDILTIDGDGRVAHAQPMGCVRLNTANGNGSTNTKIRRFLNTALNQGGDITYVDSATLGASFTINKSGVYAISYSDQYTTVGWVGISLNTTQPTTDVAFIPVGEIIATSYSCIATAPTCVSSILYLTVGDVVRAHNGGNATGSSVNTVQFTITRVA